MKSRITIEIDFENNNQPFIEVLLANNSEDVRDKILKNFTEKLLMNNVSVIFGESFEEGSTYKKFKLIPNIPVTETSNQFIDRTDCLNPDSDCYKNKYGNK